MWLRTRGCSKSSCEPKVSALLGQLRLLLLHSCVLNLISSQPPRDVTQYVQPFPPVCIQQPLLQSWHWSTKCACTGTAGKKASKVTFQLLPLYISSVSQTLSCSILPRGLLFYSVRTHQLIPLSCNRSICCGKWSLSSSYIIYMNHGPKYFWLV